jgi:formylglycine-generating enzyme required for sulfatase activity
MPQIFVSYSSVDRSFCAQLAGRLRRIYDYESVWYDEGLHGGEIWWNEILTHVAAADIVIFLMSRESLESLYCTAELAEAQRLGKQILPVLIRSKTQVPPDLRHIQYIDMASGIDADNITELQAAIRRMEKKIPAEPPSPLSPDPVGEPEIPAAERSKRGAGASRGILVFGAVAVIAVVAAGLLILSNQGGGSTDAERTQTQNALLRTLNVQQTQVALGGFTQPASVPTVTATQTEQDTTAPTDTPTDTPADTSTDTLKDTETDTSTDILALTDSVPSVTQAATLDASHPDLAIWERMAIVGVIRNSEWQSHTRTFDGFEMALVPVGCFMMGTGVEGETLDESPAHQQCFNRPFWIDVTEVTNEQYGSAGAFTNPNQPRELVTWEAAISFCASRDARLPTEREWEYVARGPDGLEYPWGDAYNAANFPSMISDHTWDVGSFRFAPSWVGALDMSGNVWEWVSSMYRDYEYILDDGRESAINDPDTVRVIRGGSYLSNGENSVRAAYRYFANPSNEMQDVGFRYVKPFTVQD